MLGKLITMCLFCKELYLNEQFYRDICPLILGVDFRMFLFEKDSSRERIYKYFCKVYKFHDLSNFNWWTDEFKAVEPCV